MREAAVPKCPSPQNTSATTTGTTTTPTSIENVSADRDFHGKGPGPQLPTDSLTSSRDPGTGQTWAVPIYSNTSPEVYTPAKQQPQRYNPANYPAALKLLVSNNVAGSIIGRAGQTISELQTQSNSRIKLSQTGDYYPGTQDRVCLVQGEPENVKAAVRLLLERFYMLQEHQHSQHMAWQLQKQKGGVPPPFDFVVRLLVPASSCGMIIGKSGSNIKFMEETTGVSSVRLSSKDAVDGSYPGISIVSATTERTVTVTGPSLESCVQCLYLIVDGMVAHPDTSRYNNMTTSYSRILSDAYAASTGARPVLVSVPSQRHSTPEHQLWDSLHGGNPYGAPSITRRIASSPDLAGILLPPRPNNLLPDPQTPDRLAGFGPVLAGSSPFPAPVQMPGTPTTGPQVPPYMLPQPPPQHVRSPDPPFLTDVPRHDHGMGSSNVSHSMSAPDLLAIQMEQSMHINSPSQASLLHHQLPGQSNASQSEFSDAFTPQAPVMTNHGDFSAQVLVPDNMVGSILGRGGKTLTELQMMSGTRIRISQRGEYMPGTRSRIVTIQGPTAQTVWQAQLLMSQRIVLPPTAVHSSPSRLTPSSGSMDPSMGAPVTPSTPTHASGHTTASPSSDPASVTRLTAQSSSGAPSPDAASPMR